METIADDLQYFMTWLRFNDFVEHVFVSQVNFFLT